jgi:hypothetical protein
MTALLSTSDDAGGSPRPSNRQGERLVVSSVALVGVAVVVVRITVTAMCSVGMTHANVAAATTSGGAGRLETASCCLH